MSIRRLVLTSVVMAVVALALSRLTPGWHEAVDVLAHPQRTADTQGADVLLVAVAAVVAWAVWLWGALGLALTAVSAVPGALGATARVLLRVLLPAGARRGAAFALGVGLGVAAPVLVGTPAVPNPVLVTAGADTTVPDWPTADADVPDWPADGTVDAYVVVRGDCLWDIAAARLAEPSDAAIATAVQAWWSANAEVIGPDPDLIHPGQVLRPPDQP